MYFISAQIFIYTFLHNCFLYLFYTSVNHIYLYIFFNKFTNCSVSQYFHANHFFQALKRTYYRSEKYFWTAFHKLKIFLALFWSLWPSLTCGEFTFLFPRGLIHFRSRDTEIQTAPPLWVNRQRLMSWINKGVRRAPKIKLRDLLVRIIQPGALCVWAVVQRHLIAATGRVSTLKSSAFLFCISFVFSSACSLLFVGCGALLKLPLRQKWRESFQLQQLCFQCGLGRSLII